MGDARHVVELVFCPRILEGEGSWKSVELKPLVGFHGKEAEQGLGVVGEGSTGAV